MTTRRDPLPDMSGLHLIVAGLGLPILAIGVPLAPLALAPGMAALAVLGSLLLGWRRSLLPPTLDLALPTVCFLALVFASLAWTTAGSRAVSHGMALLYLVVPALLLIQNIRRLPHADAMNIAPGLVWAGLGGIAIFAMEEIAGQPIMHLISGAAKSALDYERDLNRAALLLTLMSGPLALLAWQSNRRLLATLTLFVPLPLTVAGTSQSAAAAHLGLLVMMAIGWRWPRFLAALLAMVCTAGFLFCAPIVQALTQAGWPRVFWLPESFRHRILTWNFVAEKLRDHPWLGWGFEASRAIPGGSGTFPGTERWGILPLHPHNFFLQVRLELGWVGAALMLWLMLALVWRLSRLEGPVRVTGLSLYGACVLAQCFAYGAWQGWLICGMLFAALLVALAARIRAPS